MFCEKCGSKIQEGASFCTNCGTKIGGSDNGRAYGNFNGYQRPIISNETQVMATNGGVEALNLIKDPIGTIKSLKEKDNTSYLVIGAITVIISILTTIIMVSLIKKSIGGYFSLAFGSAMYSGTFKLIAWAILSDIVIMAGIGGVAFASLKMGYSDTDITYFSGLKISIAAYFYMKVLILVALILCFISGTIGTIALLIAGVSYIILLFCGINEYAEYRGSIAYYMTVACIVSMFIINYLMLNIFS